MSVQELINRLQEIPEQYRGMPVIATYNIFQPDQQGRITTEIHKKVKRVNAIYGIKLLNGNSLDTCLIAIEDDVQS